MKTHKIEKIINNIALISVGVLVLALISQIIFSDKFVILRYITNIAYGLCGICPLTLIFINYRRSQRGYKFPLSIAAMKNAKSELPEKIYKFCSLHKTLADDFKGEKGTPNAFWSDESKLKTLENKQLWMSDFSSLNDPFEGQLYYIPNKPSEDPEIQFAEEFFLPTHRDKYIQTSFSYDYYSILMWGHYANALKGYCVEYQVLDKDVMEKVKIGDTIKIIKMDGEPQYTNREGIVTHIDDAGQIHGTWGGCAIIPEVDGFIVIEHPTNY